jgi:hypothetical protein
MVRVAQYQIEHLSVYYRFGTKLVVEGEELRPNILQVARARNASASHQGG